MFFFCSLVFLFFFNDTATTEIYTLSLHDALPIFLRHHEPHRELEHEREEDADERSEEHTSELQSRVDLVCRLLLEKKKNRREQHIYERKKKDIKQKWRVSKRK